jgi:hypothetical protein
MPSTSAAWSPVRPAEFHQLGLDRVLRGQLAQSFVDRQQILVWFRGGNGIQRLPLEAAAMFASLLAAGVVDKDAPHDGGGRREEVAAVIERAAGVGIVHQPQISLVDQPSGIERLSRLFAGQLLRGKPAQVVIDKRQQLFGRLRVAGLDLRQDEGDFGHKGLPMQHTEPVGRTDATILSLHPEEVKPARRRCELAEDATHARAVTCAAVANLI